MTVIVFVSRLVPFMSFDLMSYAAGLSAIKFWRFALATLLGLLPVSFALAYLGDETIKSDVDHTLMIILITGAVTLVPLVNLWRQPLPQRPPPQGLKAAQDHRQSIHFTLRVVYADARSV